MALQLPYSAAPGSQVAIPSADLPSYANAGFATLNGETVYAEAYWQVSGVSVAKTGGTAHLIVYLDSSKNSAVENKFIEFNYDINGENPIKQAYKHLKALPEFANAVDC
jgi:hypothetical protein